jgi:thiamine-phosphate pyrophosphorylase
MNDAAFAALLHPDSAVPLEELARQARELDADGVHLGQGDLPLAEARQRWTVPGKRFGLSTHDAAQAAAAIRLAPDYIGVGPVFATPTKAIRDPVLGLAALAAILRQSPLTTVAIGGIDAVNLPQVRAHGAVNYAVVRAVNHAVDPAAAIHGLQESWRIAAHGHASRSHGMANASSVSRRGCSMGATTSPCATRRFG